MIGNCLVLIPWTLSDSTRTVSLLLPKSILSIYIEMVAIFLNENVKERGRHYRSVSAQVSAYRNRLVFFDRYVLRLQNCWQLLPLKAGKILKMRHLTAGLQNIFWSTRVLQLDGLNIKDTASGGWGLRMAKYHICTIWNFSLVLDQTFCDHQTLWFLERTLTHYHSVFFFRPPNMFSCNLETFLGWAREW